ncbi:MAG: sigma-70 family RNA polymerase sigma factor [Pirellulales bacterium]
MDLQTFRSSQAAATEMLLRARRGDPAALGELLNGFREYLLAVANRELDDGIRARVGASDLVQETFLKSQRVFADFQGATEEELRGWLAQILVNRCRDVRDEHLQCAKRTAVRDVPLLADGSAIGPADALAAETLSPSGRAVVDEEVAQLLSALATLSDEFRRVVWLRNWEGLGFEEIGRQIGRSADAARKIFSRAIQKLAEQLEAIDGAPGTP